VIQPSPRSRHKASAREPSLPVYLYCNFSTAQSPT
jgi:hypothetical protein